MAKGKIAINAEYAALRTFCALVNAMPYAAAMAAARLFGWAAFRVFRFKRRRTLARIRSVFPEMTDREATAVAVNSLQNILQTGVEMMRAPRLDRRWMDSHVVDGRLYKDRLQSYVDEGNGVVIMVPHSGNWYMAAWSMAKYGLPLFALAAKEDRCGFYRRQRGKCRRRGHHPPAGGGYFRRRCRCDHPGQPQLQ